jgi:hypothetical protein
MTEQEAIQLLWRYGHFRNPDMNESLNISKADLPVLTFADESVEEAIRSYQAFAIHDLDELVLKHHTRADAVADGDAGPATFDLWLMPRCGHPDFPVDDDPDLAPMWSREEANWPDACRREILVGRDYDTLPGLTQEQTDGIYWALCNNWTAAMQDVEMTPKNDQRTADGLRMFHDLRGLSRSTLAWHVLARNRCDDRLQGRWNSNVQWGLSLAAAVGTHEVYHGLGGNHTNDPEATSYPSITPHSRARMGYPNATDIAAMEALGYHAHSDWQQRKPSEDELFKPRGEQPEPPTPDPTPDEEWARTEVFQFLNDAGEPIPDMKGQIWRSV